MILRGYVRTIVQSHDLTLQLTTDRGSIYVAKERTIDEFLVAASIVDPCHLFITILTE